MLQSPQAVQRQAEIDPHQAGLEERAEAERPGFRQDGSWLHARHRASGLSLEEEEPSTGGAHQPHAGEDQVAVGGDVRAEQAPAAEVGGQGLEEEFGYQCE